ncbi:unnamed protein product [Adineta steineri]|uniref:TRPM SLOG domain-containing protein n=1 Tax=Adineta steineri TaxID=433720 RepID=A0A818NHD5_9BILA|nr:unnamed protein product [Adineta steineri]
MEYWSIQIVPYYLHCDIDTNLDKLCLVLLGIWDTHVPGLIMHMVSDTSSLLNAKLEREILKGISDAATASDACIVTSGYKEDNISQIVAEVIYKSRVKNPEINFSAIGVGKWGNIRDVPTIKPRTTNTQCDSCKNNNNDAAQDTALGRYTLMPNLTQYIFFDDGTYDSMDNGDFASKLAEKISRGAQRKIPLVTILVGADLHALELIFTNLESNIPVLIIDQSGPLATIMCKHLKLTENMFKPTKNQNEELTKCDGHHDNTGNDIDTHLLDLRVVGKTTLKDVLNKFGNMRLTIIKDIQKLYDIIRQKEYTIVAQENLSQIDNRQVMTADDQMRRALRWSIVDDTDGHLIISAVNWKDTKKIHDNRKLIIDAMSKNLVVFVSNFVKLGIDFAALFASTADSKKDDIRGPWSLYLKKLYSEKMRKNTDSLYLLEKIDTELNFKKEPHVTRVLKELVGDFMKPFYKSESSPEGNQVEAEIPNRKIDSEYIYRDLFLWCVLTHRLDMAKIFLNQMKTRICSALIASKILKSLLQYAPDHDLQDKLSLEAEDFEMYAIECVRCSYLYDREQVCELIIRRVDLYGGVTCLQMAIAADDKKFLNEDACNALLTNIWFDKIDPVQERTRLIINLFTMGFAQFGFSIYDKNQSQEKNAINRSIAKRQLAKNGIDYGDDYQTNEPIRKHFLHFHNRPIVKYCYTCFGYILFLLFFSYYMLFAFDPPSDSNPDIHWTEILTIIFVTTMFLEDCRQFYFQDDLSWTSKILTYFDLKNRSSNLCLVLPAYVLFYVGLILRFVLQDETTFGAASFTIGNVQEKAQYIWAYDRCGLVRDYYGRPALFPPFTFLISLAEFCRWCRRQRHHTNEKKKRYFKMIPADDSPNLDKSWSEFERYSTNDYVRRLLDEQAVAASNIITTDVTSEILSTNRKELKHLASDIHQLNDSLTHSRTETDDKLLSIESTVSNLQGQVDHVNTRLDTMIDSLDWIMSAIERVKMAKTDPPIIKQNSRISISNQGQQEPPNNAQDNLRHRKPDGGSITQQAKQETSTASDICIIMPDEPNDEQNV